MNYAQAGQHGPGTIGGMAAANLQQAVSNLAPPTKRDTLQAAIADFQGQIERVTKLSQQLDAIADRLEGARPTGVMGNDLDAPPHPIIDDLRRKQRALNMLIASCEDAASRIANAVG